MVKTGDLIGPFRLERQLGAGGMGVVFQAEYTKNGQRVALKLLSEDIPEDSVLVKRFERELHLLQKLKHPNIVRCFGGGLHEGKRFIAMELVSGGSLADLLRKRHQFSWEETIRFGQQTCEALQHAHDAGIVHRDLKPANLLLTAKGEIKLSDFGLARDQDETRLTKTGKTMGTYFYMAPEQISGSPPVTHRTDLYALGCLLFECLTGRPPFVADDPVQVLYKQMEEKPPKVAQFVLDCPVWLDHLITQLLDKNPEHRGRDAISVLQALVEVEDRVRAGASVSQHMASGQPSSLSVADADQKDLKPLVGKRKKPKSKKKVPIYERTSVLLAGLGLIIGLVVWSFWPLSEDQVYQRGLALWQTGDDYQKREARDRYFEPYLTQFPQGKHAASVVGYLDELEMERIEKVLETHARLGRDPDSEAERLYVQARQYERFGDVITAIEKYNGLAELLKDDREARPFVNLAKRQVAQLQSGQPPLDRRQIVTAALMRAERLYADQKNLVEARKVWESIVKLYGGSKEMAPLVKLAGAKLTDPDTPLDLDLSNETPTAASTE